MSRCTSLDSPVANYFSILSSHCSGLKRDFKHSTLFKQSTEWKFSSHTMANNGAFWWSLWVVELASDTERKRLCGVASEVKRKWLGKDLEHDRQKVCCDEIKLFVVQATREEVYHCCLFSRSFCCNYKSVYGVIIETACRGCLIIHQA